MLYEKTVYKVTSCINMKSSNFKIYKFIYVQNVIKKYIHQGINKDGMIILFVWRIW